MGKKLFVFGIGGTGSRVIKAMMMLFSAGIKLPKEFRSVIPILIDPDTSNGDLNRTKDILTTYQKIRKKINEPNDFFSQEVKTINEIVDNTGTINPDYFQFCIDRTNNLNFKDYIGFNTLDDKDKAFLRLLYSEQNLKSQLNVGFKGNPNMGAIVLNQFTSSSNFKKFGQAYSPGDAIFIINSIFGGTGAAGFPLLLKTLRSGNAEIANSQYIKDAPIGGITYLPYFNVEKKENSQINSETFEEKTKNALEYYNRSILEQNKINSIYFLGNRGDTSVYENHEGEAEQKNKAHFLELAGALSIFDFCNEIDEHIVTNGIASQISVKEFGIERNERYISFSHLDSSSREILFNGLAKFKFFSDYIRSGLEHALGLSRWTLVKTKLDNEFFQSPDYKNEIEKIFEHFDIWISEMSTNNPGFSPFQKTSRGNSLRFIKDSQTVSGNGFMKIDRYNCEFIDKYSNENQFTQFFKVFSDTLNTVLAKNKIIKS